MRRHPKALFAESNLRQGFGPGRIDRGTFATRRGSSAGNGSGALPVVRVGACSALFVCLIAVLFLCGSVQAASRAKLAIVGAPQGATAGQLSGPHGVAVNLAGAGGVTPGDFYVADANNNRIDEFSAAGAFVRAWGYDVVSSGQDNTGINEQQKITVKATGGKFSLRLVTAMGSGAVTNGSNTITGVATSFGAFKVGDAISGVGIPNSTTITAVGSGTLTLSANATSSQESAILTATENTGATGTGNLTAGSAEVTGLKTASGGFAAGERIAGSGIPAGTTIAAVGAGTLTLSAAVEAGKTANNVNLTGTDVPYNATAEELKAALTALSGIGAGNLSVSGGPGDATGTAPYTVTFSGGSFAGNDVETLGSSESTNLEGTKSITIETPVTGGGIEVCRAGASPADVCKAGSNIAAAGAVSGSLGVAVDQANGNVYALSKQNRRVDAFSATGAFEGAFGWKVNAAAPAAELQFCTVISGCLAAENSQFAGALAGSGGPSTEYISTDGSGNVYVPDPFNHRIDEVAPSLNGSKEVVGASLVRSIGWDVIPAGAAGTGTIASGSKEVTSVVTTKKAFLVGQVITDSAGGIPAGTTITAVNTGVGAASKLTLSNAATKSEAGDTLTVAEGSGNVPTNEQQTVTVKATGGTFSLTYASTSPTASATTGATGTGELTSGSTTVGSLVTSTGTFVVGEEISAAGVPAGTTIAAVGGGTLTLSKAATENQPASNALSANLPSSAPAGVVQSALAALPNIGLGNVEVSGGPGDQNGTAPYTVTFIGKLGDTNVGQLTSNASRLSAAVGTQLTCTGGPSSGASLSYQWLANGVSLGSGNGAQTATYTVLPADAGKSIQCMATAANTTSDINTPGVFAGSLKVSTSVVAAPFPTSAPPTPPLFGISAPSPASPTAGTSMACAAGAWSGSPTTFTYQWYVNGHPVGSPTTTGSTSNNYTLQSADVPGAVQCAVTGNNASGSQTAVSGIQVTSPVPNPVAPTATAVVSPLSAAVATSVGGGAALETCTTASTCKAGLAGNSPGQFLNESPVGVSVDSSGNIYAIDNAIGTCGASETCRVEKFNANGTLNTNSFGPSSGECNLSSTSGNSTATATIALGIDPVSQNVIALKKNALETGRVCELDSSGNEVSIFPAGSLFFVGGQGNVAGLAVGTGERVYAANGQPGVYVLGPVPPPSAEVTVASEVTTTTAKLNGKVIVPSPGGAGFNTTYHFEYSADNGLNWAKFPIPDASAGETAGSVSVSQKVTELQPNLTYRFRLVATTSSSFTSSDTTFTTGAEKPTVAHSAALPVTGTSATLTGTVNPNSSPTSYRFEWGTTPAYGEQSPEFEPFVGSGGQPVPVKATISGLSPLTTYHFRLVATNGSGSAFGPDTTFTTNSWSGLNGAGLPDERAIELVSPADKRPSGAVELLYIADQFTLAYQGAEDGQSFRYPIQQGLADATAPGVDIYRSERSSSSWDTRQASPPSQGVGTSPSEGLYASSNLGCELFETDAAVTPNTPKADVELGVFNLFAEDRQGNFHLISNVVPSNALTAPALSLTKYAVLFASEDCSRVVFQTGYKLLPGTPSGIYEFDHGTLRDVGLLPSGVATTTAKLGDLGAELVSPEVGVIAFRDEASVNSVSANGPVFFHALSDQGGDSGKQAVYVRKNPTVGFGDLSGGSAAVANVSTASGSFAAGQVIAGNGIPAGTTIAAVGAETLTLSQPASATKTKAELFAATVVDASKKQGGSTENNGAYYETGSPDGSHLFFEANYGLTTTAPPSWPSSCKHHGDGCDLYDYNVGTATLTDLSADANPYDSKGAETRGVVAISNDGSYVYFVAQGQLVPGKGNTYTQNSTGSEAVNLYLAHSGTVTFITTLPVSDLVRDSSGGSAIGGGGGDVMTRDPESRSEQVTPDGHHLLFTSRANLTGYNSGGVEEAYLYSTDSNSIVCISCRPDGEPSVGHPPDGPGEGTEPIRSSFSEAEARYQIPRSISDDGSRIFFMMPDALAPGALAGSPNVYEWEKGKVYLLATGVVTPGLENINEGFMGTSKSGNDAFVVSSSHLDPRYDFDTTKDLYDFRVSGGFPSPPPAPVPCDPGADQCQGSPTPPPPASSPATDSFSGVGNPPASSGAKSGHPKKKHHKKHHKKRHDRSQGHRRNDNGGGRK